MKTPSEEAINLFNSMKGFRVKHSHSKKCAKVCVQRIMKLECLTDEAWLNVPDEYKIQYWKEVLIELEKI